MKTTSSLDPPLNGPALIEAVHAPKLIRKPLICGFLYQNSILMIAADAGTGKSVISAQVIAQSSCGMPVFGVLEVPVPVVSYYIQFERSSEEILDRFHQMEKVVPINYSNIFIDDRLVGVDLLKDDHAKLVIDRCKQYCPPGVLIHLDPIFASVSGGLSTDDKATAFTRFSTLLQKELKSTNYLNHHTVKDSYDREGGKIEKVDPYYGSTWLKAHVTGYYFLQGRPNQDGVLMTKKKDTYTTLLDKICLNYDPNTFLSHLNPEESFSSKKEKLILYLNGCLRSGVRPTVRDMISNTKATARYIKELLSEPQFSNSISEENSPGKPSIFTVLKPI